MENQTELTAEQIYHVIRKLTGKIRPAGESNTDEERLKNTKKFIEVFDLMHTAIDDIAYGYKDSPYAPEKRIGDCCREHLNKMGIPD